MTRGSQRENDRARAEARKAKYAKGEKVSNSAAQQAAGNTAEIMREKQRRAELKKQGIDPDAEDLAKKMAVMTVVEEAEEEKKEEEPEVIGASGEVVEKKEEVEGDEVKEKPVEVKKPAAAAGFGKPKPSAAGFGKPKGGKNNNKKK